MGAKLVHHHPLSGFPGLRKRLEIDLRTEPYWTIQAGGLYGDCAAHYWLEDDGVTTRTTTRPETKPPYRIPSMAEVAALSGSNGLTAVSTFSGCGGSCLGLEWAGYRVLWASEFVPAAQEVYRLNHPGVVLDTRDVRLVQARDVLDACGIEAGDCDLLEGSPPCASFSTAGRREEHWGKVRKYSDTSQRTDDLFFEFVRLLEGIRPKAFLAENVSGLIKGKAKGYFIEVFRAMRAAGYVVESRLLDAQWLGVPQQRQRIIFQGVRQDLADAGLRPAWPTPLPYRYSVLDAIPELAASLRHVVEPSGPGMRDESGHPGRPSRSVRAGRASGVARERDPHGWFDAPDLDLGEHPAPTLPATPQGSGYADHALRLISNSSYRETLIPADGLSPTITASVPDASLAPDLGNRAIGREWDALEPGEQSRRYFNLIRPDPDAPSPTVTSMGGQAGIASVTHPVERRKFTIAELRRICGFPDDFVLTGSYAQQWERLGRSVPPPMMRAVAERVRDDVLVPWRDGVR